jgi:hypothetical protein
MMVGARETIMEVKAKHQAKFKSRGGGGKVAKSKVAHLLSQMEIGLMFLTFG